MQAIYETAQSSRLFSKGDIKVRVNPFKYFNIGDVKDDFIHVFANITEGRNTTQKSDLSKKVVSKLITIFPDVPIISMNIRDFEKVTYCNKSML